MVANFDIETSFNGLVSRIRLNLYAGKDEKDIARTTFYHYFKHFSVCIYQIMTCFTLPQHFSIITYLSGYRCILMWFNGMSV